MCRAWDRSRAHSVERRQASRDMRHDGLLGTLGATGELAGNGASVPDQLGSRISVGGMVCAMGPEVVKGLRFVCSDMWKPYLQVIAAQAGQALHVLDRFHITSHLNQAVDQVRRAESTRLGAKSKKAAQRLKHMRWPLLRRGSRVRGRARQKLNALLASQAGHRTGLGSEGDLLLFLALQIRDLGRRLSRLLVLPGHAQPSGTDEKGGPHAARP